MERIGIMIERVYDEKLADNCDQLLTLLIRDEKQYDNNIDDNYEVKDYFKNVIKNKENILLCYKDNDVIKGYIYLKRVIENDKKGYLVDGLYVLEDYRRQGIAKKLVDYALKLIKDSEFININVMADNKNAINLYKSFGFKEFRITLQK